MKRKSFFIPLLFLTIASQAMQSKNGDEEFTDRLQEIKGFSQEIIVKNFSKEYQKIKAKMFTPADLRNVLTESLQIKAQRCQDLLTQLKALPTINETQKQLKHEAIVEITGRYFIAQLKHAQVYIECNIAGEAQKSLNTTVQFLDQNNEFFSKKQIQRLNHTIDLFNNSNSLSKKTGEFQPYKTRKKRKRKSDSPKKSSLKSNLIWAKKKHRTAELLGTNLSSSRRPTDIGSLDDDAISDGEREARRLTALQSLYSLQSQRSQIYKMSLDYICNKQEKSHAK